MRSDDDQALPDKTTSDNFQSNVVFPSFFGTWESALQPCSSPCLQMVDLGASRSHTGSAHCLKYMELVSLPVISGMSLALHTAAAISQPYTQVSLKDLPDSPNDLSPLCGWKTAQMKRSKNFLL